MTTAVEQRKLEVGDKVYFFSKDGTANEIVINKVGRKWADSDDLSYKYRIDRSTLECYRDGYSRYQCYWSREEWLADVQRQQDKQRRSWAWDDFRREIPYNVPASVTVEMMDDLRKQFGMPPRKVSEER